MIRTTASMASTRMAGGSPEKDLDDITIELCPNNSPCVLRRAKQKEYCTMQYADGCRAYKYYRRHMPHGFGEYYRQLSMGKI